MSEEELEASLNAMVQRSMALAEAMGKLLAGEPRMCQGAALADCLSRFIAGHYPGGQELMDTLLETHFVMVRAQVPTRVRELKKGPGKKLDG